MNLIAVGGKGNNDMPDNDFKRLEGSTFLFHAQGDGGFARIVTWKLLSDMYARAIFGDDTSTEQAVLNFRDRIKDPDEWGGGDNTPATMEERFEDGGIYITELYPDHSTMRGDLVKTREALICARMVIEQSGRENVAIAANGPTIREVINKALGE